jgi:hypothetical protein
MGKLMISTMAAAAVTLPTPVISTSFMAASPAFARHGADDATGQIRRGRGADDGAGHIFLRTTDGSFNVARRGRGVDDAPGHQRQCRGCDDGPNHT